MKKFLAILLAAMMLLAMTAAFAEETATCTISVNGDDTRTYEVLQIFTGDYANGILSNVKWGVNGSGTTGEPVEESVLNALTAVSGDAYSDATQVATIMNYVNTGVAAVAEVKAGTPATVPTGYYLMRETMETTPDNYVVSLYIVEVAEDVVITPKGNGTVDFNKKIKDTNDSEGTTTDWQDSADYDIGDAIPFRLYGKLPANYASFDSYYLKFTDEMEDGLTFNADSVVVKVDNTEITTGFTVVADEDNHGFTVEFADVKAITTAVAGSEITVEYTATLNENAVLGNQGNMNKANMTYSNNPNSEETGTTKDDAVIAFTYQYVVNKVDATGNALPGAEFKLEKYDAATANWNTITVVKNDAGTVFTFTGLDDGKYRLTETETPDGYNDIPEIIFHVVGTHTAVEDAMTGFAYDGRTGILTALTGNLDSGSINKTAEFAGDAATGTVSSTIVNKSGASLPETGGIGTTLFYLLGGLMAAGSALTLVVRRRADAEEE
ncbi:MAG: isopeptide-forming domain-containing fimbrial protein [Clostridia bacterium]|nr:isopeptide-forming domain-containing fimbrial protein [Clostridia bacterium]